MGKIQIDTERVRETGRRLISEGDRLAEIGQELQRATGSLDTWAWDGRSRSRAEPLLNRVRPESARVKHQLEELGYKLVRVANIFEQEDNTAARNLGAILGNLAAILDPYSPAMPAARSSTLSTSEQIEKAAEMLRDVKGLTPEEWEELSVEERLEVLQQVENVLAEVQGRPPVSLVQADPAPGVRGQCVVSDPPVHMVIDIDQLKSGNLHQVLDTVAHEGRHTYQWYAIHHPGFHPDEAEVNSWRDNWLNNYANSRKVGYKRYRNQPIEADAFDYGDQFADTLAPQDWLREGAEEVVDWMGQVGLAG